jgi:hypothetical protein
MLAPPVLKANEGLFAQKKYLGTPVPKNLVDVYVLIILGLKKGNVTQKDEEEHVSWWNLDLTNDGKTRTSMIHTDSLNTHARYY